MCLTRGCTRIARTVSGSRQGRAHEYCCVAGFKSDCSQHDSECDARWKRFMPQRPRSRTPIPASSSRRVYVKEEVGAEVKREDKVRVKQEIVIVDDDDIPAVVKRERVYERVRVDRKRRSDDRPVEKERTDVVQQPPARSSVHVSARCSSVGGCSKFAVRWANGPRTSNSNRPSSI